MSTPPASVPHPPGPPPSAAADPLADPLAGLLVTAAHAFPARGWVFTGFNWPILAARLARRLARQFVQVLEPGGALHRDTDRLMTSTTDYFAYADALCWSGSTTDVLLALVRRCELVVVDAANVDVAGRTNTHAIGPIGHPRVRLPGGGGGPDVMARARNLVLLHGGAEPERITGSVEHVTGSPTTAESVHMVTRWGTVALDGNPRLLTLQDGTSTDGFVEHLRRLGVTVPSDVPVEAPAPGERALAADVLAEARAGGYRLPDPRA